MQHPDEGTIHAWLDGALGADEAAAVDAHVQECPQCAAAVAEARGFIAASSRILTALDNAPRGVIPAAAPPPRRFDPMVWRIAASVLVIAGGTVLVLRNQGGSSRDMAATAPATEAARPTAAFDAAADSAPTSNSVTSAPAPSALSARIPVPRAPEATGGRAPIPTPSAAIPNGAIAGAMTDMARRSAAPAASSAPSAQKAVSQTAGIGAERAAPPPAPPAVSAFRPSAGAAAASVATADREVATSESLKVIGSPRRIGASVTVYEIAGDTVTLTESKPVIASAPMATSLQAIAPRSDSSTIRTITWVDPTTGNTLSLSGRTSEARLQQLRLRIEKQRAEAKKTP